MIKKTLSTIIVFLSIAGHSLAAASEKIVVYYFYGKPRCVTCQNIDKYTSDVVKSFNSKDITYKAIDFDLKENKKYKTKYNLFTKSVVLSKLKNNEEIKFKNLDKIFFKVNNEKDFKDYIQSEIKGF